ncbi:hypothetical protein [Pedobacter sp. KBW06]|uniref:hypothetical protein n=1 Tax=Pedobacter sp. KBW06 TaxID=2153359 RepID=UPI000F5B1DCC|nr:hypothetical protein [Pedobacter sp. KBW06]
MPALDQPPLTPRMRRTIKDQYTYKQILDSPEKAVDLFDAYHKLWGKLPNNGSTKYAKPFLKSFLDAYATEIDYSGALVNLASVRFEKLKPLSSVLQLAKIYSESAGKSRKELGKEIIRADIEGNIYRMIQDIPKLHEAMGEMIRNNGGLHGSSSLLNAAKENIILLDEFASQLDLPQNDLELLLKAPAGSLQELLRESIEKAIEKNGGAEGGAAYDALLEQELASRGANTEEITKELKAHIDAILKQPAAPDDLEVFKYQMEEARGWGALAGMLVATKNPKLGNAIINGTKSAVDAYEAFSMIATIGFTAASFATGVGAVMTTMSIIQSLNGGEDNELSFLAAGLRQINESIQALREEIGIVSENIVTLIDQVDFMIKYTQAHLGEIKGGIDLIIDKVNESKNLQMEADFEEKSQQIETISIFPISIERFISDLEHLGNIALIESSNVRFTRLRDSELEKFEFLSFPRIGQYDSFIWSPIEKRPVLLVSLYHQFMDALQTPAEKALWKSILPELQTILKNEKELLNPIISGQATEKYISMLTENIDQIRPSALQGQYESFFDTALEFRKLFSWFHGMAFGLSSETVLKSALRAYTSAALDLLFQIFKNIQPVIHEFKPIVPNQNKMQLDTFLFNPTDSNFADGIPYTPITYPSNLSVLEDFFAFSFKRKFTFDFLGSYPLVPPFMAGQRIYLAPAKIDLLNRHYDNLIANLPENIDQFIYLLGRFTSNGTLKIQYEYFIGTDQFNPAKNYYFGPNNDRPLYGAFSMRMTIDIDGDKTNINLLKKPITITIFDCRIGLNRVYDGTGIANFPFSPNIGPGRISFYAEHDTFFPSLPSTPFNPQMLNEILDIFRPASPTSFNDSLKKMKELGVYIALEAENGLTDITRNCVDLEPYIENSRRTWTNLSTAILCHSESSMDTSVYFEFLNRQPKILDPALTLSSQNSSQYFSGENLSDLLLLWLKRKRGEDQQRLPFDGLSIKGIEQTKPQDFYETPPYPIIYLKFDMDKENEYDQVTSYELYEIDFLQMLDSIKTPDQPNFYGSILPHCDRAMDALTALYRDFYFRKE